MPAIDLIGTVVLATVTVVNVNAVLSAMPVRPAGRIGLAAAVGAWIGLQAALTSAGAFSAGVPYIGISVMLPLVGAAVALSLSPAFRAALLSVPTALLVGLNVSRVFGAFFLVLAASGRLGGPFPQSAGWGDIATGALALPLALAVARGGATRGTILAWNAFGALDLVAAVALGVLSAEGSPVQVIHAGAGSDAIAVLPWTLIPTVLVPFYLIVHATIFLKLRAAAGRRAAIASTP